MKKRKRKKPLTHARVIRMSPRRRMALSIKDMPKYPGKITHLVGETHNHFPDRYESRRQRGSQ